MSPALLDQTPDRVVVPRGDIDLATADELLQSCLDGAGADVVVDLTSVNFMDTSGYKSILRAGHELEARGGSLSLQSIRRQPARLIDLMTSFDAARTS